jgi:hypothetical protein
MKFHKSVYETSFRYAVSLTEHSTFQKTRTFNSTAVRTSNLKTVYICLAPLCPPAFYWLRQCRFCQKWVKRRVTFFMPTKHWTHSGCRNNSSPTECAKLHLHSFPAFSSAGKSTFIAAGYKTFTFLSQPVKIRCYRLTCYTA